MRKVRLIAMLLLAGMLAGAAEADNKTLAITVNGLQTEKIDSNTSASVTFTYSNLSYWDTKLYGTWYRNVHVRLYLSPNNATSYSNSNSFGINYSAATSYLYTEKSALRCTLYCYNHTTTSWIPCTSAQEKDNISIVRCMGYYERSLGTPMTFQWNLPATAPLTQQDTKTAWTGRDYSSYGDSPTQNPANESWGNTTIATPAVNITNVSIPSKQKINLGQSFEYNITVRNENTTNHTGKAYGVFLYPLTDGISITALIPPKMDIASNGSHTYRLTLRANKTLTSFWVGARDNGTSARAIFNSTFLVDTINITDQLLVGVQEPANQSYKGGTALNITANITDINGLPLASGVSAYANITGIRDGIPLYPSSGLYRGNYTINSTQPTPWEIIVYANDSNGNRGGNTSLFYDLTAPIVANLSAPNITDRQNATINVSVWDALGVSGVKAQVLWTTTGTLRNYTLTNYGGNGYSATIPQMDVEPGAHNVTIFANDTSGNLNNTAKATFRVNDTAAPMLENASSRDARENESALLNISAWDISGISRVWVRTSTGNYSMQYQGGNTYNLTIQLSAGEYNLTFYANDTGGNTNTTAGTLRVADTTPPSILVIRPETGAQAKLGDAQNISANVTDNYAGVDRVWIILDSNRSKTYYLNSTGGLYGHSITETLGPHRVDVYANDTNNNTRNTSASFTVIADIVILDLSPSPQGPQNAGKNITWATTLENAPGTIYYQYNISRDDGNTWRIGRDWSESNIFAWNTNASDAGLNLVRVYISNSSGAILGNRTSAAYNISATYRVEAEPLQYGVYMRGENITFAARVFEANGSETSSVQAAAAIPEGQAALAYNGTHYTGTFTVPANATAGNRTANISAYDAYNSGSRVLGFNVSSSYALQLYDPYANDSYLRGESALVDLTVKNARGEALYNLSGLNASVQRGNTTKQAVGLTRSGEHYRLYLPFVFNATDTEGEWTVFASADQSGNSGNASTGIILNATLLISANPASVEVYNPILLDLTVDRQNTTRPKENASLVSDAYFWLNNTETILQSSAPLIGSTPLAYGYSYDTENNGTGVSRLGQWKLRINISNNKNYGETETTIQVTDTQRPIAKTLGIGDSYKGRYLENSDGAQAYPNDMVLLRAENIDNFNTTSVNITIRGPSGINTTIPLEKYWSRECRAGLAQQDCDDAAGGAFRGSAYQVSRWNSSFSQTEEAGNYTVTRIDAADSSGNANTTHPGYSFEIVPVRIGISVTPAETNISSPVAIAANITGNLTALDYVRINISGRDGSYEYAATNISYTATSSDWHTVTVKIKSAAYLAENSSYLWVNYGTPALTTKLEDDQTQLNGTYKTVNMSVTAVGGDLGNVRIGSRTTNESVLKPDFGEDTMAVLGDINSSQTITFPFGFSANETGTVNITMVIKADQAKSTEITVTYSNYSIVPQDTQPPQIVYANTTAQSGYANINESVKVYSKITDNVEVAGANVSINCTDPLYNRADEPMAEEVINTELVWSYQFAFTGQPAACSFNISAIDTSGQAAAPMQTGLGASTAYSVTASKTGAEPLMRGETINFTVSVRTINGNSIDGANLTYLLAKQGGGTNAWEGSYGSGYYILQSDPDGEHILTINASKYGNRGNVTLTFATNSTLILDARHTQEIMRGDNLVFNMSVKNVRGQDYDAMANLTFLNQTSRLSKTFAWYTHTQKVPLGAQLGERNISVLAYRGNNTGGGTMPARILPANLSIRNLRVSNTKGANLTIGKGDNVTVTLELLTRDAEPVTGAIVTARTSAGETINFTMVDAGAYSATAILNASNNGSWTINATAEYLDNNPEQAQKSIIPINKKWRDVDSDGYLEFAEDPTWMERYDYYRDITPDPERQAYSREFYHFPLSPHNGFMIVTPQSYSPDVFWSPYDDLNTTIMQFDLDPVLGNENGNPYEYYVDTDGDGDLEKQYADGQLKTISGKRLVCTDRCQTPITNGTAIGYAFDLHTPLASFYDTFLDTHGGVTVFCGGVKQTQKTDGRYSAYVLGFYPYAVPRVYWDAETNAQYKIYQPGEYNYVDIDASGTYTEPDLRFTSANNTCTFDLASCGTGGCQPQYGENTLTCPADCTSTTPPNNPGGGSTPSSGAPAAVQTTKPPANATEKETETEGFDIIIQSPANLLVTKGNNLTFQITLASTSREYALGLSFKTGCCNYSYYPESLALAKGGSADVTVQLSTTLSTKAGDYTGELAVTYANYTKSRTIQVKVEESPAILEFSDLKRTLLLLKENIRQLNQTAAETKQADEEYSALLTGIAEAEKAIEENDPGKLAVLLQQTKAKQQGLSDTVKVLMKKQGIEEQRAAIVLPEQPSYLWAIILFTVLIIGSAASVIFREQIKEKMFRKPPEEELQERIEELKAEEARIVQMKKSTEREYFSRKLDQKTFMHIMSDYESKQIDIKARLAEAQQKLGELTKPKSEGEKVELLELQKSPAGRRMLEQTKKIGEELEKRDYNRALEAYKAALEDYNRITSGLAMEEQKFLYEGLNREYARLEEFRSAAKKTSDLYSALRNCRNCISSEKYDLAKHFFEQAQSLHRELSGSEFYRKSAEHEEMEKLYKEISEFHKPGE